MRTKAFTLVQTLAVVGIVAALCAVLVPVLLVARSRAASARCVGQLHQIGLACSLYQNDNDGQLPTDRILAGPPTTRLAWRSLAPYVGERSVFVCPSAARDDFAAVGYVYRAGVVRLTSKDRRFFGIEPESVVAYCLDHTKKTAVAGRVAYTDYALDAGGHYQGRVNAVRMDASAFSADGRELETWVFGTDGQWYPKRQVPSGRAYTTQTQRFPREPWPPQFQL